MINSEEIAAAALKFGVPDTQIVRDHFISHMLAAIGDWPEAHELTFFGGTALCRTWLPDLRLSEDIDLLVAAPSVGEAFRQHAVRRLRGEFAELEWVDSGTQHQVETWTLSSVDIEVKVQFAQWRDGWEAIPITPEPVDLRYSDLPPSTAIRVPTPSGFAAMKLMAWFDRRAPRDLYDLAALADAGHVDHAALDLVKKIAGYTPGTAMLERKVPRIVASTWQAELGHQLADASSAEDCLRRVRTALGALETDD